MSKWEPGHGRYPAGYVKQWDETGGRTISTAEFAAEIVRIALDVVEGSENEAEAEFRLRGLAEKLENGA